MDGWVLAAVVTAVAAFAYFMCQRRKRVLAARRLQMILQLKPGDTVHYRNKIDGVYRRLNFAWYTMFEFFGKGIPGLFIGAAQEVYIASPYPDRSILRHATPDASSNLAFKEQFGVWGRGYRLIQNMASGYKSQDANGNDSSGNVMGFALYQVQDRPSERLLFMKLDDEWRIMHLHAISPQILRVTPAAAA
jgi:hypothetical protein